MSTNSILSRLQIFSYNSFPYWAFAAFMSQSFQQTEAIWLFHFRLPVSHVAHRVQAPKQTYQNSGKVIFIILPIELKGHKLQRRATLWCGFQWSFADWVHRLWVSLAWESKFCSLDCRLKRLKTNRSLLVSQYTWAISHARQEECEPPLNVSWSAHAPLRRPFACHSGRQSSERWHSTEQSIGVKRASKPVPRGTSFVLWLSWVNTFCRMQHKRRKAGVNKCCGSLWAGHIRKSSL